MHAEFAPVRYCTGAAVGPELALLVGCCAVVVAAWAVGTGSGSSVCTWYGLRALADTNDGA